MYKYASDAHKISIKSSSKSLAKSASSAFTYKLIVLYALRAERRMNGIHSRKWIKRAHYTASGQLASPYCTQ